MFQVGDKVSYPMHGAGLIKKIEEKEILGETRSYYVVHIEHGNMDVMVPVDNSDSVGLRPIEDISIVDKVINALGGQSSDMDDNWNRRNRDNMERLKTGNLEEISGVIRDLVRADRKKKLSTGEKKMLSNAKVILASEICMITKKDETEVISMIEGAI